MTGTSQRATGDEPFTYDEKRTFLIKCSCGTRHEIETDAPWVASSAGSDHLARSHFNDDDPDICVKVLNPVGCVIHEQYNWSEYYDGERASHEQCGSCGEPVGPHHASCPNCGFIPEDSRA